MTSLIAMSCRDENLCNVLMFKIRDLTAKWCSFELVPLLRRTNIEHVLFEYEAVIVVDNYYIYFFFLQKKYINVGLYKGLLIQRMYVYEGISSQDFCGLVM